MAEHPNKTEDGALLDYQDIEDLINQTGEEVTSSSLFMRTPSSASSSYHHQKQEKQEQQEQQQSETIKKKTRGRPKGSKNSGLTKKQKKQHPQDSSMQQTYPPAFYYYQNQLNESQIQWDPTQAQSQLQQQQQQHYPDLSSWTPTQQQLPLSSSNTIANVSSSHIMNVPPPPSIIHELDVKVEKYRKTLEEDQTQINAIHTALVQHIDYGVHTIFSIHGSVLCPTSIASHCLMKNKAFSSFFANDAHGINVTNYCKFMLLCSGHVQFNHTILESQMFWIPIGEICLGSDELDTITQRMTKRYALTSDQTKQPTHEFIHAIKTVHIADELNALADSSKDQPWISFISPQYVKVPHIAGNLSPTQWTVKDLSKPSMAIIDEIKSQSSSTTIATLSHSSSEF